MQFIVGSNKRLETLHQNVASPVSVRLNAGFTNAHPFNIHATRIQIPPPWKVLFAEVTTETTVSEFGPQTAVTLTQFTTSSGIHDDDELLPEFPMGINTS